MNILPQLRVALRYAGACFFAACAFAQNPSVGVIEGRVLNANSGRYVDNARVTVEGSTVEALTDSFGQYRLTVPAGVVRLKAVYLGLPTANATVTVGAGQTANQDFNLGAAAAADAMITLDPFVVTSTREANNTAIAINEQRTAPNIKNVVATELVGDIATDNVAEIMKYLPGVTLDTVAEAAAVNVRGFSPTFTTVTTNGALISSASPDPSRNVTVGNFSANSVSRVEVTKSPTPDMPASSLGGSINMVSKSAFESPRAVLKYRAYISATSDEPNIFRKTAGPRDEYTYKGLPSLEFSYLLPVTKNFGLSINAVTSNQYSGLKHELTSTWRFTGPAPTAAAPNVATPDKPYFQSMSYGPEPRTIWRDSFGIQADWRPAPNQVVSASVQLDVNSNLQDALLQAPTVGSSESSAVVGGEFLTYGPTFTHGASGRGADSPQKFTYDQSNSLEVVNLTHRFTGRIWQIDSGLSGSLSKSWWRDLSRGHFFNVRTSLTGVSRVFFDDIGGHSLPAKITTFDAAGKEIDWTKLSNYRINSVETAPRDGRNTLNTARLNVKRALDFLPFPASIKVGGMYSWDNRDMLRTLDSYTYVGPDGAANTADDSAGPYADAKTNVAKWRFVQAQEIVSSYKLADLFQTHPEYFTQSNAVKVSNAVNRITRSFDLTERIGAAYVQGEAGLLGNRLRVVSGVRFEKTSDSGNGPLFDPNGAFQRDSAGKLIRVNGAFVRRPEAGAAGSLQELPFIRKERGSHASRSYDGYYPSVHLTYDVTKNFLLRAAYAETFGRPNLANIVPNTTLSTELPNPTPGSPPGTITVANSGLKPYAAKSYDVSMEYYFPKGGVLSVGGFRKDLRDFFGVLNTIATPELLDQFGLDPGYAGWTLQSTINAGTARISGIEANYAQSLGFLPWGGKYFSVFADYTKLHLEGSNQTDFTGFIPESASLGFTYSRKPIVFTGRWNYRGRERRALTGATLPGGFDYLMPFPSVDLSFEYQISKHVSLFGSARNALNRPRLYERWNSQSPIYSRYFRDSPVGAQVALGIKGAF